MKSDCFDLASRDDPGFAEARADSSDKGLRCTGVGGWGRDVGSQNRMGL